jgi:plasmid stabilization system protein ParE
LKFRFHAEADADVVEAFAYYESQQSGIGIEFIDALEVALNRVLADPESFATIAGQARSIRLQRFPYSLIFHVGSNEVVIIAVAHAKRRASYWRRRLTSE